MENKKTNCLEQTNPYSLVGKTIESVQETRTTFTFYFTDKTFCVMPTSEFYDMWRELYLKSKDNGKKKQ